MKKALLVIPYTITCDKENHVIVSEEQQEPWKTLLAGQAAFAQLALAASINDPNTPTGVPAGDLIQANM